MLHLLREVPIAPCEAASRAIQAPESDLQEKKDTLQPEQQGVSSRLFLHTHSLYVTRCYI